jgi:hypothetical protein
MGTAVTIARRLLFWALAAIPRRASGEAAKHVPSRSMTPSEAIMELLKLELQAIQSGIRGLDTILFQIKGWCVTVTVAIAGFALANDRAKLLFLGLAVVVAFWLVDAHYKSVQRVFINRDREIQSKLEGKDPLVVLESYTLKVPGLAPGFAFKGSSEIRGLVREALNLITAGLYVLVAAALGIEALIL